MARYLGGLSWQELGKQVLHEITADNIFDQGAVLAFYFLLALFPLLIFLISIAGLFTSGSSVQSGLVHWLTQAMPQSASGLVENIVQQTAKSGGGGKLSFGIAFSLWTASSGMAAVINGLDIAFDVKEERSWVQQRLTALWLTLAIGALMLAAIAIILFGSQLAGWLGGQVGLSTIVQVAWEVVQWPLAIFFAILAFALVYRYAPNKRNQSWRWMTPGALVGVFLWLVASFGFRMYLIYFNTYSTTYGSLGAAIVLMMWFYVTGIAILIGGEVDSQIEAQVHGRAPSQSSKPVVMQPRPRQSA